MGTGVGLAVGGQAGMQLAGNIAPCIENDRLKMLLMWLLTGGGAALGGFGGNRLGDALAQLPQNLFRKSTGPDEEKASSDQG